MVMTPKVIIIGHGFSSRLGMIRTFGKMGCKVDVIVVCNRGKRTRRIKPVDCFSKYVNRVLYSDRNGREGLVELLLNECVDATQKPVLIPDSDFAASAIDLNLERLKDFFLFPNIDLKEGRIVHWMDKLNQKDLAKRIGMNVAKGCVVRIENGVYDLPSDIHYPCFPKPLASAYGGKRGMRKCNNERELRDVLDGWGVKDVDVLVEEFIPISKEYAVVGFANQKQVIIPAVIVLSQKGEGGHVGVAKIGELIPVNGFESIVPRFMEFAQTVGLTGLFDIDFYESDGVFYFGEMNMRYGASGYALFKNGINLPGLLLNELLGGIVESLPIQTYSGHSVFMNERVCIDDWFSGKNTLLQLHRELKNREQGFVFDPDDQEPYRQMKKTIWRMIPKRELLKVIRRFRHS